MDVGEGRSSRERWVTYFPGLEESYDRPPGRHKYHAAGRLPNGRIHPPFERARRNGTRHKNSLEKNKRIR